MPRMNDAMFVGLVSDMPSVQTKDGQIVQMAVPLLVINGTRTYGEKNYETIRSVDIDSKGYDNVWVLTKDKAFIEEIKQMQVYDLVMVKGAVRVTANRKKSICPDCGFKHVFNSTKTTVYPIFMQRLETVGAKYGTYSEETEDAVRAERMKRLADFIEVSNIVKLIGVVCREPELYQRDSDGKAMLTFPLAVKRKYFISEDDMSINVDFPYVKLYGSKAKQQYGILHKSNLIMIDGFLHTREIIRRIECEQCGNKYSKKDRVSEIVPYSVDYIRSNISDTEFERSDVAYRPQIVGSNADIDLKYVAPDEKGEEGEEGEAKVELDEKMMKILNSMND